MYIPKLAGYYLDIENIRDTDSTALSIHEFPFTNRNLIENLGQKTRKMHVECVFMDIPTFTKGWETGSAIWPVYEAHFGFLDIIRTKKKSLKFTHPETGEIEGYVENISTYYDDTIKFARIAFDFLQEITTEEITTVKYIIAVQAAGFLDTNNKLTDVVEDAYKNAPDPTKWVADAYAFNAKLDARLRSVTAPLTSISNTISHAANLPGEVMGTINSAVSRVVESFVNIRNAPASFVNNCIVGVRELKAIFTGVEAQYVHVMGASRVAYEAGVIYETDDQNRLAIMEKETKNAFDIAGNYNEVEVIPETMTVNELETTLGEIRTLIDEVIQFDRDNDALKKQAKDLQEYVNNIKLQRERIEEITTPLLPLHIILLNYGLSYQAAERILKLNPAINNPNFVSGDIDILLPAGV